MDELVTQGFILFYFLFLYVCVCICLCLYAYDCACVYVKLIFFARVCVCEIVIFYQTSERLFEYYSPNIRECGQQQARQPSRRTGKLYKLVTQGFIPFLYLRACVCPFVCLCVK